MIEIKNISKRFEDKVIFHNFSLVINDGNFLVLSGNSGCGKTTLLNMIGGLELVDEGQILVDGFDVAKKKGKEAYYKYKAGFLFQNFALIENKTVRQNLEMVQKSARSSASLEEVLEQVGLGGDADTYVYKLSGGEQQRVALARLMFKRCDIILADEPCGSLDAGNSAMVMQILHRMNDQGRTVVLVTHDEKTIETEQNVVRLENITSQRPSHGEKAGPAEE